MKAFCQRLTAAVFLTVLAMGFLLFLILPDQAYSPEENRSLAQMPDLNDETLFSGSFASDMNRYVADQFPFRNFFVRLKSGTELLLAKAENNGVLYSMDQLAVRNFRAYRSRVQISGDTDYYYAESVEAQLHALNTFSQSTDLPVLTLLPPRTIDIADSAFSYDRPWGDDLFTQISDTLEADAGYVELLPPLRQRYEDGEYVYYKTDHHWTTLGAYYAYGELMKALGQEADILPLSAFTIEEIPHFSGTTAAKGAFPLYDEDVLQLWHYAGEDSYAVVADGTALPGLYERKHLTPDGDTYSVFLDGTHNITTITKKDANRQTLLVAKDSFGNSLIPFLAAHYDIVAVNLRTNTNLTALTKFYQVDGLVVIYNIENLITAGDLGNIR